MGVASCVCSMSYSFGRGGGMPHEFCVCLCVGWVCAVLSVVGLGALLCRVCVCLVWMNSLHAQLPLSNSLYSRCVVNGLLSVRFMGFGCVFGCTVPPVPAFTSVK